MGTLGNEPEPPLAVPHQVPDFTIEEVKKLPSPLDRTNPGVAERDRISRRRAIASPLPLVPLRLERSAWSTGRSAKIGRAHV